MSRALAIAGETEIWPRVCRASRGGFHLSIVFIFRVCRRIQKASHVVPGLSVNCRDVTAGERDGLVNLFGDARQEKQTVGVLAAP